MNEHGGPGPAIEFPFLGPLGNGPFGPNPGRERFLEAAFCHFKRPWAGY